MFFLGKYQVFSALSLLISQLPNKLIGTSGKHLE